MVLYNLQIRPNSISPQFIINANFRIYFWVHLLVLLFFPVQKKGKEWKILTNDILRELLPLLVLYLLCSLIVGKRCNFQELHYRKTTVTHIKTLPGAINHHHKFIVLYYPTEGQKGLMCCLFLSEHTNDPPVILSFKDH